MIYTERESDPLPVLMDASQTERSGRHFQGKNKGWWHEISSLVSHEVYVPQRYKAMQFVTTNAAPELLAQLEQLDARWVGARQLYKLWAMQQELPDLTAVVNVSSVDNGTKPVSGSFYLIAGSIPLYVCAVIDIETACVRLVWSTMDFKAELQKKQQLRYVVFAMEKLVNRPLFLNSSNICSYWWKLRKDSAGDTYNLLRTLNAVEMNLYKDPTKFNHKHE